MNSNLKIFVTYYKKDYVFSSDIFEPLFLGKSNFKGLTKLLCDNTGENISDKNRHYGELTGHYWVWKNYLPQAHEDYIGFCHYCRFPELVNNNPLRVSKVNLEEFTEIFDRNSGLTQKLKDYDIIMSFKFNKKETVREYFTVCHGDSQYLDLACGIIKEKSPEYNESIDKVLNSTEAYLCYQFIMKKDLLNEYFEWIFDILGEVEKRTDNWADCTEYLDYRDPDFPGGPARLRMPAYLAERLINIWLGQQVKERNLKILDVPAYFIRNKRDISHKRPFKALKNCVVRYYNNIKTAWNFS
jgi:hypothetical protein